MGDMDTRKSLESRWSSSEFVAAVARPLEEVFAEGRSHGSYDLRGIIVGMEGPVPSLWHSHLQGAELTGLDLSYSRFSCSFIEGVFRECKFAGSTFDACRMGKARFEHCDFSGSALVAKMDDAVFIECSFEDARLTSRGPHEYGGRRARFSGCVFRGAVFKKVEFRATTFDRCVFDSAAFEGCDLRGVRFVGAVPVPEKLVGSDLRGATADGQPLAT